MVLGVASVAGMVTAALAAMTIWLLLAQPLRVVNAVNTGDLPTLAAAYHTQRILDAARLSAREHRQVMMSEVR